MDPGGSTAPLRLHGPDSRERWTEHRHDVRTRVKPPGETRSREPSRPPGRSREAPAARPSRAFVWSRERPRSRDLRAKREKEGADREKSASSAEERENSTTTGQQALDQSRWTSRRRLRRVIELRA